MSVRLLNAVFEMDLPPKHKIVMLTLADHADVEGYCFPGQATLARRTSIPERSLRRILGELEERGLIRRERRTRQGGQRTSDGYDLAAILAGGPTGQNEQANRPTVAGTREPSGEPSGTDLGGGVDNGQSSPIPPAVSTDSSVSPVTMGMARRAGLSEVDCWAIVTVAKSHCDREISLASAITLALTILDRAKDHPRAPGRYVAVTLRREPFIWQKHIDETGLA